jgi:hypothetical protein
MLKEDLLQDYPIRRIEPVDGMAVTAQVWKEAHDYHRKQQQFHSMLSHGPGIVAGMRVIASDPPDSTVYVLPGLAVDSLGRTIVLREPVAYDIGAAHGLLYLLVSFEESHPTPEGLEEDGPVYVHTQFGFEAVATLPTGPAEQRSRVGVELARIRRRSRAEPIVDPRDAEQPGPNEIDSRFRQEIGVMPQPAVGLAVSYAGGPASRRHGHGARYLAQALRQGGRRVWVDDAVALAPGLEAYHLLYLVCQDAFQLNRDEMTAIYGYLQTGGTLFIESCRHGLASPPEGGRAANPPSDASISDLLASLGVQLAEVVPGHQLLAGPHLFASPPPGFETAGSPQISVGDGVIWSMCDYGCLWQGERRDRAASREEIRTAMEWGDNLVSYAVGRRKGATA